MNVDEHLAALTERVPSLSFDTDEAKQKATLALTHSSVAALNNNAELAKAAKYAATKALFLSPGRHKPKQYADLDARLATKPVSVIARELKLNEAMRMDKGVPYVSDSMYSMTLLALLGALEITKGPDAVLSALKELGIVKLLEVETLIKELQV